MTYTRKLRMMTQHRRAVHAWVRLGGESLSVVVTPSYFCTSLIHIRVIKTKWHREGTRDPATQCVGGSIIHSLDQQLCNST